MGKQARKRQRTAKSTQESEPLGSAVPLNDEASKDDEERRLESLLFGKPYVPSEKERREILVISDGEEDEDLNALGRLTLGTELENMLDNELFFVDDDAPPPSTDASNANLELDSNLSDDLIEEEHVNVDNSSDPPLESDAEDETELEQPPVFNNSWKAPAWVDPDDTNLQVSLASDKRLRKLRDAPSEDTVGGREYESRLRRQYQKINPTPEWATTARRRLHPSKKKRRRSLVDSASASEEDEDDVVHDILSSTAGIIGGPRKSSTLKQGTLAIERLRDANQAAKSEGEVKTVEFHPSPQVPVLLVASTDRRLRLFTVDGLTNPHLQTLHIPSLPITNATYHPSGSSILITGRRPFYYTHDLQSGTTHRSPRGLWGTTFNALSSSAQQHPNQPSMELSAFSPDGSMLAVAGRRGYVHLVDWKAGGGQVVGSVKMNKGVKAVWWPSGVGEEVGTRRRLMTLGEDAQVYLWDVGERRCLRKWQDDGGFGSRLMSGDSQGKYLAVGATTGYVNIYSSDGPTSFLTDRPKPLKAIGNLTTSISTLRFNHDAQLLAIASNAKKDQMRLIHLPSLTAFGNWPTSSTPLGHVTAVDFSSGSEYVAVGNNRGRVLLYHLKDFGLQ